MITDIVGKIKNTRLPKTKPLFPLFEAISNSIHAIEEANISNGQIIVQIERDNSQIDIEDKSEFYPIRSINIEDNGIGFTKDNYDSFLTAESTYKYRHGAKGIGRFLWLKAFESVKIESIYSENGSRFHRGFNFLPQDDGIFNHIDENTSITKNKTIIHLEKLKEEFKKYCPKNIETISRSIIDHFIIYLLLRNCPKIIISDEEISINLNDLYRKEIEPSASDILFDVKKQSFGLFLIKLYNTYWPNHLIHLCADNREVKNINMCRHIPDLTGKKEDAKGTYLYQAYIISDYLDKNVNAERTDFDIIQEDQNILFEEEINQDDIINAAINEIKILLKDYLNEIRTQKINEYKDYINANAPEYRPLVQFKPNSLDEIPPHLPEDKLDVELFRQQKNFEVENKVKQKEIIGQDISDIKDLDEFKEKYVKYVEEVNAIGKSKLTQYIIHRRAVLELFERYLSLKSDDTYWQEDSIHKLIFPLKKTSDDIDFSQQNLWIIDERLSYHKHLASDIPLKQNKNIKVQSNDRPDLLIFNGSFAFVNSEFPYDSIVIIEFKRPGRDAYSEEDKNPVDQVIRYIRKIREGKAKNKNGQYVQIKSENTPFYAYIICEFSPKVTAIIESKDYIKTPDGYGYFYFHKNYNAYIEILSFNKLLKDAKERNRILFEKLGIV